AFNFLTLAASVWLLSFFAVYSSPDPTAAIFWVQIANSAVVFIPTCLFTFALASIKRLRQNSWLIMGCVAASCFFFTAIWFAKGFVQGVRLFFWGYYSVYGPLTVPFL